MSQQPYIFPSYQGSQSQQPYPNPPASAQYGAQRSILPTVNSSAAATTNQSFEYNGNRIPGLGLSSLGPSLPSVSYGLDASSWYQGRSEAPPSATSPTGEGQALHTQRPGEPRDGTGRPSDHRQPGSAAEEGELSVDDSEDIYEPTVIKEKPDALKGAPHVLTLPGRSPGSLGDADGSSIYDSGSTREEGVLDSTSASIQVVEEKEYSPSDDYEPAYQARERSGSYSPQLTPGEIQRTASAVDSIQQQTDQLGSSHESSQSFASSASLSKQPAGGTALPKEHTSPKQNTVLGASNISSSRLSQTPLNRPRISVSEAKKKAQEAILGLWSVKVRYQTYIDEGFDADLIKSLFTDLGLDIASPQPVTVPTPLSTTTSQPSEPQVLVPATDNKTTIPSHTRPAPAQSQQSQASKEKSDSLKTIGNVGRPAKTAGEERKDRIARMLAEKKQKSKSSTALPAATTPSTLSSQRVSTPTAGENDQSNATASVSAKERIRAENNSRIKQRLAALQRSQEEAEAKRLLAQAQTPTTTPSEAATASSGHATAPTPPRQLDHGSSSGEQEGPSDGKGILHRSKSSASTPLPSTKNRHLKRPVASDFDNYPSNGSQLKRTRIQEPLIIDVSDDDEDVEMEMESPVDGPVGASQHIEVGLRQNSLGSFPPLTNPHTWRHKSSPIPSAMQTPPEHAHKLDFLHRQIEEAKKMIAEAEAKKASRRPNGSSTPVAHTPSATDFRTIIGVAESEHTPSSVKSERRDRIASYHLPLVEAALREKQAKLKRLHEEAAQIELELQASLAERQKLTTEIEDLEQTPEVESDLNGSDSHSSVPISSGAAKEIHQALEEENSANSDENPSSQAAITTQQNTPPSHEVSGDNMDIESSKSFVDENDAHDTVATATPTVGSNIVTPASDLPDVQGVTLKEDISAPQDGINVSHEHDQGIISAVDAEDQAAIDADVSMQTSSFESPPPSHANISEELPAQISSTDKTQVSEREDGEIADEDPYEPSPAQLPAAATQAVQETPTGEAEQQPTISSHDLLSYQSPLRYFHAYRFHPKYFDDVPGGLKSMTYNSRIDVQRPLCPYSANDSPCPNGPSCEFQHFENMVVPESDIIAQLGSTDMYTGEQKVRFIEGLKKLLNDLKTNKIRDFDSITKAILKYRADFVGDTTKVLALDGVIV